MNRKIAHLNFTWKTTRSEFIACDLKELNPFAHLLKPLNDARGDGGCLGKKGQNSDRLTVKLQC